jgi:alpha-tubulin suppressor-like RCC1 family protein
VQSIIGGKTIFVGGLVVILLLAACGSGPSKSNEVVAVAAGYEHTCVVTGAGGVRCWGANESGQLGNGTTTASDKPVDVTGLKSGVVAIAAGGQHTCALTGAGGVKCWGYNDGGQLGNGKNTYTATSTPVGVRGLASGVTAIAAGDAWVCALTSAGAVRCWGWNLYGQLGDGTSANTSTPVGVSGLASGVSAISANLVYACALTTAGHVKCWGSTTDNNPTNSNVPVGVSGLGDGVTAITAGGLHACAITSGGGVKCWGYNAEGELGNGSRTNSQSPVEVSGLTRGATGLGQGSTHGIYNVLMDTPTCALTSAGGVKCWGPNGDGQLGNGTTKDSSRPVEVSGLTSGIIAIAVGGAHTCAITKERRLKCWGSNSNGQLGNGSLTNAPTPVDVAGF